MNFTGERYIPGVNTDFALEHRHRYMLACEIAHDRDVLDIACGEGYGSAMLAATARSVHGVDISAEAVAHAAAHYALSNLTFLEGSAADIPLPDACVDLVVSFETIEHHALHHEMMREIVRVLRPGGVLCLSSPDRTTNADILPPHSNPYHVKELNRQELEDLITGYFSRHILYAQRSVMGSLILNSEVNSFSTREDGTARTVAEGISRPKFYMVVASNGDDLPPLDVGILESPNIDSQVCYELQNWKVEALALMETEKLAQEQLRDHIEKQAHYISGIEKDNTELQSANATLQSANATLQTANADLIASLSQQIVKFEKVNLELEIMLNSRSWRLTRPLRQFAGKLRTLRCRMQSARANIKYTVFSTIDGMITGLHTHWNALQMFLEAKPALCALRSGPVSPLTMLKERTQLAAYFASPDETLDKLNAIPDEAQRNVAIEGFKRALTHGSTALVGSVPAARPRVVLISGEPHTPGHTYRIERLAQALHTEFRVYQFAAAEVGEHQNVIMGADLLWIWRATYSPILADLVCKVKASGKCVVFDIDDLCFVPEMATAKYMDAIRSNGYDENAIKDFTLQIQKMMQQADLCVASTLSLAQTINHAIFRASKVLPNGFDREGHNRSVLARLKWKAEENDGLVRIGYAAGTTTHQADLRMAVPALAAILNRHPQARLVLFEDVIKIEEFPELVSLEKSIEWRKRVPLQCLPDEMARFDINIAPLECGNPFCDAKSELKFFEAALVNVPTVASPTKPYAAAIRHGKNGFLASSTEEWETALDNLITDSVLRDRVGNEAYRSVLWTFGPENRQYLSIGIADMLISAPRDKARVFVVDETVNADLPLPTELPDYTVDFSTGSALSKVAVVIPLHNYEVFVLETLDSLLTQTMQHFDVVVVDDASTDNSLTAARNWLQTHAERFASVSLLRNTHNAKLSLTRNAGIAYCHSEYIMLLDADNTLLPNCLEICAAALDSTAASMAYAAIEKFGAEEGPLSDVPWNPDQFRFGNYIDAMVMLRKACWVALGGFTRQDQGWEDYDFWCKMAERGFWGIHVPQTAARYRVHENSMLHTHTDTFKIKADLVDTMMRRHPWLCLPNEAPQGPSTSTQD